MGWQAALVLAALTFIGLWALLECRGKKPPVIKYKDTAQPGCFMVGKDLK
jgi:hypothetical protein